VADYIRVSRDWELVDYFVDGARHGTDKHRTRCTTAIRVITAYFYNDEGLGYFSDELSDEEVMGNLRELRRALAGA
jgi:hypothetical protein